LIRQGRVTVNGQVAVLGQRVEVAADVLKVDGERVRTDPAKRYLAVNKPEGIVVTSKDPEKRQTVMDIVGAGERLFPVGRLDIATTGLIILTNDGELAHRLMHPSYGVSKTYLAEVEGTVDRQVLRSLKDGVDIGAGRPASADIVRVLSSRKGPSPRTVLEIVIHEGRNHVVRKMLEALGHPMRRLARTAVGDVKLGRLALGTYRKLTDAEVGSLYRAVGLS
jgi:23S rRNA pseudouridine2605 synthase